MFVSSKLFLVILFAMWMLFSSSVCQDDETTEAEYEDAETTTASEYENGEETTEGDDEETDVTGEENGDATDEPDGDTDVTDDATDATDGETDVTDGETGATDSTVESDERFICNEDNKCESCTVDDDCPDEEETRLFKTKAGCRLRCGVALGTRYYCAGEDGCTDCELPSCPQDVAKYHISAVCERFCSSEPQFICRANRCFRCDPICPADADVYDDRDSCLEECNGDGTTVATAANYYSCYGSECQPCIPEGGSCQFKGPRAALCSQLPICSRSYEFTSIDECNTECTKDYYYCDDSDEPGCQSCSLPECPEQKVICESLAQCERLCFLRDTDGSFVRHKCDNETSEVFSLCPRCIPTCDRTYYMNCDSENGDDDCEPACTCRSGYVSHDDECIAPNRCPACPGLSVYRNCAYDDGEGNGCPPTCKNPDPSLAKKRCRSSCKSGCECPPGLLVIDKQCMSMDMCPAPIAYYCAGVRNRQARGCIPCSISDCPNDVPNYHSRNGCEDATRLNPMSVCKIYRSRNYQNYDNLAKISVVPIDDEK